VAVVGENEDVENEEDLGPEVCSSEWFTEWFNEIRQRNDVKSALLNSFPPEEVNHTTPRWLVCASACPDYEHDHAYQRCFVTSRLSKSTVKEKFDTILSKESSTREEEELLWVRAVRLLCSEGRIELFPNGDPYEHVHVWSADSLRNRSEVIKSTQELEQSLSDPHASDEDRLFVNREHQRRQEDRFCYWDINFNYTEFVLD
jgi:hypothetical protein